VATRAVELLAAGERVGVLAPHRIDRLPAGVDALPPAGGAAAYAQCLYQRLREADRRGLDVLLAVPPPETGIGAAVADRLRRAAAAA
jgi:L-threonylcarbamoyladenylate synthase